MTLRVPSPRIRRSALVGLLATACDLGALMVGVEVLHLAPRAATPIALALGVTIQFVGNKLVAFQDRSPAWLRQAMLFLSVEAAGYAANVLIFGALSTLTNLPYLPLRLAIGSAVYFGICLPLWSRIFRDEGKEKGSTKEEVLT